MCNLHFVYPFIHNEHLGCFRLLAVMSNAVVNMGWLLFLKVLVLLPWVRTLKLLWLKAHHPQGTQACVREWGMCARTEVKPESLAKCGSWCLLAGARALQSTRWAGGAWLWLWGESKVSQLLLAVATHQPCVSCYFSVLTFQSHCKAF